MTAIAAINMELSIPAGAADYAAEAGHRFDQDTILYSLLPHMHLRGKAFRFEAVYTDGRRESSPRSRPPRRPGRPSGPSV